MASGLPFGNGRIETSRADKARDQACRSRQVNSVDQKLASTFCAKSESFPSKNARAMEIIGGLPVKKY
jgi:hypothetical protein